jgi:toxin FitB
MSRIVLDTDVASRAFKSQLPSALLSKLVGMQPCITFITLGELTKWSARRRWGAVRQDRMARWLTATPVVHSTDEIARLWGELAGFAEERGRPRPVNDSWIAACCLVYDMPLATFNVKDFEDFAEYEGLTIVSA